jgi:hypothetical protein
MLSSTPSPGSQKALTSAVYVLASKELDGAQPNHIPSMRYP